jgi:LCP family protein required for cell wall assembly
LAEKNTNDNQNSKKKHKWIGIFLIALLLLFIGLAGYYLERDLEPVPDNQIEDSQVLDESSDSSEAEKTEVDQETNTEMDSDMEEDVDDAVISDTAEEKDTTAGDEETVDQESKTDEEAEMQGKDESVISDTAEEDKDGFEVERDTNEDAAKADLEDQSVISNTSEEEDKAAEDEKSSELEEDITESSDLKSETEAGTQDEELVAEDTAEEDITTRDEEISELEGDTTETDQERAEVDQDTIERSVSESAGEELSEEIDDPSLLDRILSILGLAESDFSQDLNILFVGLDDEESVALGTIEADSIMIAKLRPEIDKLQIKHIDEDTNYKGQLLRKYHNGDIQLAVEEITENEIDYYVYINYLGFERVIDELGGVQIILDQEVKVAGLGLNLKAGSNLLSGKEALNFVRWRDSDSLARFERQKLLINSVMAKLRSNNILFNVKELYNTIVESYNSIETDINPVLAAEIFSYLRENKELDLEYIE